MSVVTLLLTPQIGKVGNKELGGTEAVLLSDKKTLLSKGYSIDVLSRVDNHSEMRAIPFFSPLIKIARYIERKKIWRYGDFSRILRRLADILYAVAAFFFSYSSSKIISYSFPLFAAFRPEKTLVILGSEQEFPLNMFFHHRYRRAKYFFCSNYLKKNMMEKYSFLTDENSLVLFNGIEKEFFSRKRKKKRKKIRLLFASAWVPEKGLDILLEALLLLPEKYKEQYILTISSSPNLWYLENPEENQIYLDKLNWLVSKLSSVIFLNGVSHSEMPDVYSSQDWLIVPSVWEEPFGLVAAESLASQTPVLAFHSGGLSEIITHGKNGLILKEKSSEGLCNLLCRIVEGKYSFTENLWTEKNIVMRTEYRNTILTSHINGTKSKTLIKE